MKRTDTYTPINIHSNLITKIHRQTNSNIRHAALAPSPQIIAPSYFTFVVSYIQQFYARTFYNVRLL